MFPAKEREWTKSRWLKGASLLGGTQRGEVKPEDEQRSAWTIGRNWGWIPRCRKQAFAAEV